MDGQSRHRLGGSCVFERIPKKLCITKNKKSTQQTNLSFSKTGQAGLHSLYFYFCPNHQLKYYLLYSRYKARIGSTTNDDPPVIIKLGSFTSIDIKETLHKLIVNPFPIIRGNILSIHQNSTDVVIVLPM
ncbi:hypothetical protein PGT21_013266 [Puccinia graminis f. sp. tritici]|uniref:Uncharacterized protein n=1 Tax=Puccinia graminis f. sp. tritici TaxID=56615 RepID=A0A5B0R1U4_PUCGR|nr:hypothetical protein PGT21_013266 [Puccinia graminis f. sp. tritici]